MGGTVNKNQITDQGSPFNVIKGSCRTLCATEGLKEFDINFAPRFYIKCNFCTFDVDKVQFLHYNTIEVQL